MLLPQVKPKVVREQPVNSGSRLPLPCTVTCHMGKIRRGGYVFVTWKGDHSPRHVHVYRDGSLVLKWDLETGVPMKGKPTNRILRLIEELRAEGLL
jgi:Domain of unknown function (DUF4160)